MQTSFQEVAAFCRANYPETCEKILEIAENVLNGDFLFDMPWDMERTEETVHTQGKVDWYHKLNGDYEFLYQLNRHIFFLRLGQAYCFTGEEKYLKKIVELWSDFIDRVPVDNGNQSPWRSLEVGMRAEYWVRAYTYLVGTPYDTEAFREKVHASLEEHAKVLLKAHATFQIGSNWGIIQDSGLFRLGCVLENKAYQTEALSRLYTQTERQIMADGVHWEQSCGYHNAVLFCLLGVIECAKQYGVSLDAAFLNRVEQMAEVNICWIKPDSRQDLLGDSDNNDIRDILSRSALLFERGDFKALGFPHLDYESAWIFKEEGIAAYEAIAPTAPQFKEAYLEDSGNYILRSDWSNQANWLLFHNGYTGGGHAHADKLHVSLSLSGRDVLVDAGRYTYKNVKERRAVKDAMMHNTSIVGRTPFCKATSSWNVVHPALSVQNSVSKSEECILLSGGHLGYLDRGVYCEREVLWIRPNLFLVLDCFYGKSYKTVTQYYHFAPSGEVRMEGDRVLYTDAVGTVYGEILKDKSKRKILKSLYSPNYNKCVENTALQLRFRGRGPLSSAILFHEDADVSAKTVSAIACTNNSTLPKNAAEGIVIQTPSAEYTVCLAHKELKSVFSCNGKKATGRITVYRDDVVIFQKW